MEYTALDSTPLLSAYIGLLISTYTNFLAPNSTDLNPGNSVEFHATALRYGYSYSMQGTTRRLALGILIIHVVIALFYMIFVIWFKWGCYGLKSLSRFLFLL